MLSEENNFQNVDFSLRDNRETIRTHNIYYNFEEISKNWPLQGQRVRLP